MHSSSRRSSCFIAGDDDDDDDNDYDAQSTTTTNTNTFFTSACISIPSPHHRSYSTISLSALRSFNGRLYESRCDYRKSHFLRTCAFCKKSIGDHMDIFMYRGDTPFCSEECRQEQIDIDEASEMKLKVSSSASTMNKSPSGNKAPKYSIRTSTVAAA